MTVKNKLISIVLQDDNKKMVIIEETPSLARIQLQLMSKQTIEDNQPFEGNRFKLETIDSDTTLSTRCQGRFLYQSRPLMLSFQEGTRTRIVTKQQNGKICTTKYVETGIFIDETFEIGIFEASPAELFDSKWIDISFRDEAAPFSVDKKTLTLIDKSVTGQKRIIVNSATPIEVGKTFEGEDTIYSIRKLASTDSIKLSFVKQKARGMFLYNSESSTICPLVIGQSELQEYDVKLKKLDTMKSVGSFNIRRELDSYLFMELTPQIYRRDYTSEKNGISHVTESQIGLFKSARLLEGRHISFSTDEQTKSNTAKYYVGKFKLTTDEDTQDETAYFSDPKGRIYQKSDNNMLYLFEGVENNTPIKTKDGKCIRYELTITEGRLQTIIKQLCDKKTQTAKILWRLWYTPESYIILNPAKGSVQKLLPQSLIDNALIQFFKIIETDLRAFQLVNDDVVVKEVTAIPARSSQEILDIEQNQRDILLENEEEIQQKKREAFIQKAEKRRQKTELAQLIQIGQQRTIQNKEKLTRRNIETRHHQAVLSLNDWNQKNKNALLKAPHTEEEMTLSEEAIHANDKTTQTDPLMPVQPLKQQYICCPIDKLENARFSIWPEEQYALEATSTEQTRNIITHNQLPHEKVDLNFRYSMISSYGCTLHTHKWVSNRLNEGGSFFILLHIHNVSRNKYIRILISSAQFIRKDHSFAGSIETTIYDFNGEPIEPPIDEWRQEGIFTCHAHFYEPFESIAFVHQQGQSCQITENHMFTHDVNQRKISATGSSCSRAQHNFHPGKSHTCFFQPEPRQNDGCDRPEVIANHGAGQQML